MFDSNDVTLDKMADFTQSEDVAMRFIAYGWDVETIDGHDLAAVSAAYDWAKTFEDDGGKGSRETVSSGGRGYFVRGSCRVRNES